MQQRNRNSFALHQAWTCSPPPPPMLGAVRASGKRGREMSSSLSFGITGWECREREVLEDTAASGRTTSTKTPGHKVAKRLSSGCVLHNLSCGTGAPSSLAQARGFAVPFHPSCRRKANPNRCKPPFPSSHVQVMYPPPALLHSPQTFNPLQINFA